MKLMSLLPKLGVKGPIWLPSQDGIRAMFSEVWHLWQAQDSFHVGVYDINAIYVIVANY